MTFFFNHQAEYDISFGVQVLCWNQIILHPYIIYGNLVATLIDKRTIVCVSLSC